MECGFHEYSAVSAESNCCCLYRLAVGIAKDKTAAALAVAIYGFSGMAAKL